MAGLMGTTPTGRTDVRHLVRHQVMGLAAQFLLGMAVNLNGHTPTRRAARM